ncbi:MAG: 30S ribosomal protein S8 [Desulfobacteraceae bacterium]|jgi:small subunit ribosomal protein S8|nr:30S ribosomal protein S8 [Desulfobacteraceae bacterium]
MTLTDPIADMLTRIRNAGRAKFNSVDIPSSKLKVEIARVLKEEGFVRNYQLIEDSKQGILRIFLKYTQEENNTIIGMERVSRPSRRVYAKGKEVKPVLNGMGISIVSTSRGLMTDKKARKENVGGEILCQVW